MHPESTPDFTRPNLRWLAWGLLTIAALMLVATLTAAFHLAPRAAAPMALTHLELPAGQCPVPQPGDVLHITVTALDLTRQDIQVSCLNAGPPPQWSRFQ